MKKKKASGQHSSPRKPVQLPTEWLRLAQEMATARPMPVMWFLVELIGREAENQGKKTIPAPPWKIPDGANPG